MRQRCKVVAPKAIGCAEGNLTLKYRWELSTNYRDAVVSTVRAVQQGFNHLFINASCAGNGEIVNDFTLARHSTLVQVVFENARCIAFHLIFRQLARVATSIGLRDYTDWILVARRFSK
ncbi:MAG: hypothetical protein ABSB33_11805 [Tepidisphaeraceae bacterium]|jgi:hypothetical protein